MSSNLIVQKYGGTSLGSLEKIKGVAKRVKKSRDAGKDVLVVVSAMAGETDKLLAMAHELSDLPERRETDLLLSSGERISSALLSIALHGMGCPAVALTGRQMGLVTDNTHTRARIKEINASRAIEILKTNHVVVCAGFQGVNDMGDVTTLGRGGSDTSAVALAAALGADRCDIHTDVDGVYTCDPRIVAKACKLERITYEEMLEMASQGARVLQTRSVEMAMKKGVRLQVLSSFEDVSGTLVVDEDEIVEEAVVSGIAYSRDEAKITLQGVLDQPGVAAKIFGPLADGAINVDMIVQNVSVDSGRTDLTFTVTMDDLQRAVAALESKREDIGYRQLLSDANVAKVSVIGVGMRSHAGIAQSMFKALAEKGINIQVISTSEIKVSVLVAEEYTELALRTLHTAYGLDAV